MEGDLYPYGYSDASDISIHSLRMEGDTAYPDQTNQGYNFNPLPPHGGRPEPNLKLVTVPISIHSLRMEGDLEYLFFSTSQIISIHSLRMEGDYWNCMCDICGRTFQSTPSAWRETCACITYRMHRSNFNPLPPHGGRHGRQKYKNIGYYISIHSLRMEGDPVTAPPCFALILFQSTPSAWRETMTLMYMTHQ